jgi:hypothetical protein
MQPGQSDQTTVGFGLEARSTSLPSNLDAMLPITGFFLFPFSFFLFPFSLTRGGIIRSSGAWDPGFRGANWFRSGKLKRLRRVVVDQKATQKSDHTLTAEPQFAMAA